MEGKQIEFVHGPDLSEQGLWHILFAVRSGARYQVKAVLLWTGRLDHLPGLAAWLEQTFPTRHKFGTKEVLYVRP